MSNFSGLTPVSEIFMAKLLWLNSVAVNKPNHLKTLIKSRINDIFSRYLSLQNLNNDFIRTQSDIVWRYIGNVS